MAGALRRSARNAKVPLRYGFRAIVRAATRPGREEQANGGNPDKDYKVVYSGKHDQSLLGVLSGDYDAATITSDIYDRFVNRGMMKADDVRILFRSAAFPTSSFAYAHDLEPALADKIRN
jgi:phosphonate transport system substrate-binding protein